MVTIRLSTWAGVEEAAELQELLDEINASQGHYQIIHEPAPDDYYTKVQTTLAGGTAADLIWLSQEWIAGMADQGALLDVTDCVAASDSPQPTWTTTFPTYSRPPAKRRYLRSALDRPASRPVLQQGLFDAAGMDYPNIDWTGRA